MSSSRSENDTLPARPSDHVDSTERGSGDVGLGWQGWLRWGWRQLTSMRTALILLLLMAIAAIPGSLFPQRQADPNGVVKYFDDNPELAPTIDKLQLFDVYSSAWFSAIYLLLFVSLVGCVLPRAKQHWRTVRAAPPRTPRRLERLPVHVTATLDGDAVTPEQALDAARTALRRRRFRLGEHDGGTSLAAEKGYSAETGNLAFHLALLGLLVAVAAGSFYGWSGQALLVAQDKPFSNSITQYSSFTAGSRVDTEDLAPFSIALDELKVSFDAQASGAQFGQPRSFEGTANVTERPGAAPRRTAFRVNSPIDVDGTRVFLVGNGYAPVVTVTDGEGRVAFSGPVPFMPRDGKYTSVGVVKVPDAEPRQIGLQGLFLPTAIIDPVQGPISIFPDTTDPRLFLTAFVSRPGEDGLGMDSGVPQSVYILETKNLVQLQAGDGPLRAQLGVGQTLTLPDGAGTVRFDGIKRYAALDVRHDPTKGWVLAFSLLALAGLTASLFVRRRRLWARVSTDDEGRTVVEVAGLARGDDAGLDALVQQVLDDTVAGARGAAAGEPVVTSGSNSSAKE